MSAGLRHNPPFRAEHLGSLLRTDKLLDTRHAWEAGKGTEADLKTVEDQDIRDIVKTQLDLGFHGITDGEYRRHMFWGSFWPGLEGMTEVAEPDADIFRMYIPDIAAFTEAGYKPGETVICTGKIKHKGSTYTDQFDYLKSCVPAEKAGELKLTLAAPNWYHLRYKQGKAYPTDVYKNDDEYFSDIAKAYQAELKILYDHGLRNVQFDDPNLACQSFHPFQEAPTNASDRLLLRSHAHRLVKRLPEHILCRRPTPEVHQPLQRLRLANSL